MCEWQIKNLTLSIVWKICLKTIKKLKDSDCDKWGEKVSHLEYLSCQVRSSSVRAAISPFGNLSASLRKLVSILTMWCSFSNSRCFRFSISTWRCRLEESPHWSHAHPHSSTHANRPSVQCKMQSFTECRPKNLYCKQLTGRHTNK